MALVIDQSGKVLGTTTGVPDSGGGNGAQRSKELSAASKMGNPGGALAALASKKMTVVDGSIVPPGGSKVLSVAFSEPRPLALRTPAEAERYGRSHLPDRAGEPPLAPYRVLPRREEDDPVSDMKKVVQESRKLNKETMDTQLQMQLLQHEASMTRLVVEGINNAGRAIERAAHRD